jgi:hypothetical protein
VTYPRACGVQLGLGRLQASDQRGGGSSASLSSSSSSSSQAGAESYESSPRVVGYFKGQRVVAAAAGRAHSLALTEDAQVRRPISFIPPPIEHSCVRRSSRRDYMVWVRSLVQV